MSGVLGALLPRGERFRTTPAMRLAFWVVQFPPFYAALVLLMPPPTFGTGASYALMATLASERTWAVVSMTVTLSAVVGWFSRRAGAIHFACMMTSAWHVVIAVLFLMAEPLSLSPGAMLAMAVVAHMLAARI